MTKRDRPPIDVDAILGWILVVLLVALVAVAVFSEAR